MNHLIQADAAAMVAASSPEEWIAKMADLARWDQHTAQWVWDSLKSLTRLGWRASQLAACPGVWRFVWLSPSGTEVAGPNSTLSQADALLRSLRQVDSWARNPGRHGTSA